MSGIFDQIINYSPPLIVSGTVNYKGTWNASTNNPTLNDPPAASTKGDYYVVSTAGTQFSITFGVGDWIISNGTAWEKVDLTDAVHSVFGRTGAVVGDSTDYSAVGLTNTAIGAANPSSGAFTSLSSSSTTTLNGTTVPASKTLVVTTDKLSALAATTSAELAGVISDETGSGALVFATSPTLVTPILGTPQSGTLTSCTGLPISTGVSGLGTGIATALAINTGSAGAPVLFNGALGTPSSGTVTNLTGTASININGTVGATTPSTGAFTTLSATGQFNLPKQNLSALQTGTANTGTIQFYQSSGDSFKRFLDITAGDDGGGGVASNIRFLTASGNGTITERVRVDGSGNVGIGNTSPTALLALSTGSGAGSDATSTGTLQIRQASTGLANGGGLEFHASTFGSGYGFKWSAIDSSGVHLVLGSRENSATWTERLRVNSTGLAVTGALSSTGVISKGTGNSTSGNIKINYAGSGASLGISICETTDNSGTFFVAFQKSTGADIGSISRVTTTDAVVYNTTSDGRLKENFRDFTDSGRLIDSLKPRVFDWKNSDENGKNVVGFIAQEEHAADPIFAHIGAVSVGDEDPETITKQWQRSDSALIPILVAELKSVRARLAALESK
jgi:hypothetical protein